ncbi:hypothetical protein QHH03_23640, partial [Aphanizomenon sp. 202]|nr:hypothetical protein [Aphanizomenon sp. 202]
YTSGFFVIWQKFKSHPCLVYSQQQDPGLLKEVGDLSGSCYTYKPLDTGIKDTYSKNCKYCYDFRN